MRRLLLFTCVFLFFASPMQAQNTTPRPMKIEDLFRFKRVADPQISPDGKWVCYTQTIIDDVDKNKSRSNLWLVPTDGSQPPKQLTTTDKKDRHARWSPDGKWLLFESNRSGSFQLYVIATSGGEPKQITDVSTDANTGYWSRRGDKIAFVSSVWPEFSEKPFKESNAANKAKAEEREKSPIKAKVFTKLFFRHWDSYTEDKRNHLFVISFNNGEAGEPLDVTPGDRDAYPTSTTFSQGEDFTFSPDGEYLIFTAVPAKNESWSTSYQLCRVPVTGGVKDWPVLTKKTEAAHGCPRYSPSGSKFAYRYQSKPGFEADQWKYDVVLCKADGEVIGPIVDEGKRLASWEHSADELVWSSDSNLLVVAEQNGKKTIFEKFDGTQPASAANPTETVKHDGSRSSLTISKDGKVVSFLETKMDRPSEVLVASSVTATETKNLSNANTSFLKELSLARPESVTVDVENAKMQMWILKPPGFDASKKWPLVYLVHGGPQSAWEDNWSYRWNPQIWAAQGYVVALPNPRGSTGFGQKFCDDISGDWGGKCYRDLMKGLEYLEKQPYIDSSRMASAGASFGGYMMNWFQGNTTKFKTLITHCGVYNHESMYATTEELWFDEWDHGEGKPLWENRENYRKHSPHLLAKNFKTPMLIIHNDLDFRVPVGQGLELFTTLQRLGVPSRMVNFPDEGHWVTKPANSRYWHQEVFGWLKQYVPPGGK